MTKEVLKLYLLAVVRTGFLKWFFYCALLATNVQGRDPDFFNHCFDFSTEKIDRALLAIVCSFLERNNRTYFHHSGWRGNSGNHSGNALDFRLTDYQGMNRSQILSAFFDDVELLRNDLKKLGILDKVGLGIYPQSRNPFIHLDLRGKRARWGVLGGREVGFERVMNWMKRRLNRGPRREPKPPFLQQNIKPRKEQLNHPCQNARPLHYYRCLDEKGIEE